MGVGSSAGRLELLFGIVRNPKTGEPYTNAEIIRTTLGTSPGGRRGDKAGLRFRSGGGPSLGARDRIRCRALLPVGPDGAAAPRGGTRRSVGRRHDPRHRTKEFAAARKGAVAPEHRKAVREPARGFRRSVASLSRSIARVTFPRSPSLGGLGWSRSLSGRHRLTEHRT